LLQLQREPGFLRTAVGQAFAVEVSEHDVVREERRPFKGVGAVSVGAADELVLAVGFSPFANFCRSRRDSRKLQEASVPNEAANRREKLFFLASKARLLQGIKHVLIVEIASHFK